MTMQLARTLRRFVGAIAAAAAAAAPAGAQISWVDWTASAPGTVTGTMMFGLTPVGVTYTGPYTFAQLGCGTDYYAVNSTVYTGAGVPNRPTGCDLIGLNATATHTITFSTAVENPVLALVSWNRQPTVTFSGPIEVVNAGCGHFGCGTASASGNVLSTNGGEVHGTVRVLGTYTSLTFTETNNEFWHGVTVGAESLALTGVPEPSTYVLMATGLAVIAGVARRRRSS